MIKKTLLALAIASAALTTVTANAHNFYKSDVATVYATTTVKAQSKLFSGSYVNAKALNKDYKTLKDFDKAATVSTLTGPNLNFTSEIKFGASFNLPNELSSSVAVKFKGPSINTFDSVGSKTTVSIPGTDKETTKTKYKLGKLPTKDYLTYKSTEVTLGHPQVGTLSWSDAGEANNIVTVYSFAYSAPELKLLSGTIDLSYAFGYDTDNSVKYFAPLSLSSATIAKQTFSSPLFGDKDFEAPNYSKAVEHDLTAGYNFADGSTLTAKLDRVLTYKDNAGIYTLDTRYVKYSFEYERDICGFDTTFSYAHVTAGSVDGKGSIIKDKTLTSNNFKVETNYTVNDYLAPNFTVSYTAYRAVDDKSSVANKLDLTLKNTFTAFNYMGIKGSLEVKAKYGLTYTRFKDESVTKDDVPAVGRVYSNNYGLAATFKIVY